MCSICTKQFLKVASKEPSKYFPLECLDPKCKLKIDEKFYVHLIKGHSLDDYLRTMTCETICSKDEFLMSWDNCDYFEIWKISNSNIMFNCPKCKKSKWVLWRRVTKLHEEGKESESDFSKYASFWEIELIESESEEEFKNYCSSKLSTLKRTIKKKMKRNCRSKDSSDMSEKSSKNEKSEEFKLDRSYYGKSDSKIPVGNSMSSHHLLVIYSLLV